MLGPASSHALPHLLELLTQLFSCSSPSTAASAKRDLPGSPCLPQVFPVGITVGAPFSFVSSSDFFLMNSHRTQQVVNSLCCQRSFLALLCAVSLLSHSRSWALLTICLLVLKKQNSFKFVNKQLFPSFSNVLKHNLTVCEHWLCSCSPAHCHTHSAPSYPPYSSEVERLHKSVLYSCG